jgi:hypothetical protein
MGTKINEDGRPNSGIQDRINLGHIYNVGDEWCGMKELQGKVIFARQQ